MGEKLFLVKVYAEGIKPSGEKSMIQWRWWTEATIQQMRDLGYTVVKTNKFKESAGF